MGQEHDGEDEDQRGYMSTSLLKNSDKSSFQSLDSLSKETFNTVWGNLSFAIKYVTRDTKKRLFGFLIGLLTIIIVVFVVSALYNGILKASVVFLKLAEDQIGETDVMFYARFSNISVSPFINQTDIHERLADNPDLVGTSPRWILSATVENAERPQHNTSTIVLIVDTEREQQIGLGRSWPYRPLGYGEAHVRDGILRAIGVKAQRGQKINLKIGFSNLQGAFSGSTQAIQQDLDPDPFDPNQDDNNPVPIDIGGGSGIQIHPEQLLKSILERAGFDFDRQITVNFTKVVDQLEDAGIDVPPIVKVLAKQIGSMNVTGDELYKLLTANGTNVFVGDALKTEFTVVDAIDYPYGKYPSALGNVVILDSKYVIRAIGDTLLDNPYIKVFLDLNGALEDFQAFTRDFKVNEYSLSVVAMYKGRFETYIKNQNDRQKDVIKITNRITESLGIYYPINVEFPLMFTLQGLQFVMLFLNQIFVGVVVMLALLGVILIFALLLSNVEEKTYEYGMLRALGLQKYSLIQIIVTQSMYFAIPGIIFGMIGSFFSNIVIEYVIRDLVVDADYRIKYTLDTLAVVIPVALGLSIPLVANIIPIRTALSRTLRDSLDIAHQTFNETTVRMIRLEKLGLEPWQTGVAVCLVGGGFIVYYVVPSSFIFQNLPLFFAILNCILLGMLIGLCMIAVVLQPFLEKLTLHLLVHGPDRRMKPLILKNLAGHRRRSRKTFLMFSLAIAFVIFAGVSFSLQIENLKSNVEAFVGTDAIIQSTTTSIPLPETSLSSYLDSQIETGLVRGYSYQSFSLARQDFIRRTRFGSLSYRHSRVEVWAVSENYLEVTYAKYFLYSSYDKEFTYSKLQGKPDVIKSLYVDAGKATIDGERPGFYPQRVFSGLKLGYTTNDTNEYDPSTQYKSYIDAVISQAMSPAVSVDQRSPMKLRFYTLNTIDGYRSNLLEYIVKARAMVYKLPGYFFSSYELSAFNSPVLISFDAYLKIANESAKSVSYPKYTGEIPKEKLLVRFNTDNATKIQDTLNALKSLCNADFVNIANVKDLLKSTAKTSTALLGFFNIVAAIAVVLCFFILTISFTANVRDNSWEFGVLRAIGFSVSQLIRAYIYEALCLVVAAFLCGTIIGVVIALTLVAQFNVFLEMPFQFAFPYLLFASLAVMALVVAVVGSYIPARVLRNKAIAFVLRGLE